jgi:hypothetical protein
MLLSWYEADIVICVTLVFQSRIVKLTAGKQIMKRLVLPFLVTVAFAGSAMAGSTITCEGILEHGSGGEYIVSKDKQCWFYDAVLDVCKEGEHCKVTGASTTCRKNADPQCQQIIRIDSISR